MSSHPELTLVIPCYNEAARLDRIALLTALDAMPWLRLCLVNDGSTDGTAEVLSALQQHAPDRIEVIALPANAGKAEAVRQGLLRACARTGTAATAYCGFWDADLSAPLDELPALTAVFESMPSVEWVWGIRLRALGRTVTRGAWRHYLGRGFATATSLALDLETYDTQCGAKLFRVTPLLAEVISEPFLSRWVFDVEMLSRAKALLQALGRRGIESLVYEQPLRTWHHQSGSKIRPLDFARALLELLRIRRASAAWRRALRAEPRTVGG